MDIYINVSKNTCIYLCWDFTIKLSYFKLFLMHSWIHYLCVRFLRCNFPLLSNLPHVLSHHLSQGLKYQVNNSVRWYETSFNQNKLWCQSLSRKPSHHSKYLIFKWFLWRSKSSTELPVTFNRCSATLSAHKPESVTPTCLIKT